MAIIPNQTSINQGNFNSKDLSKFANNASSKAIPIADYSMSEKIELLKSEKSKTLIKTFQLASFKKIPMLIKRLKPLPSIRVNLNLWDVNLESLTSAEDSVDKLGRFNVLMNLAFTKQTNFTNPITGDPPEEWVNNPIGDSGSIADGNITEFDPFFHLNESLFSQTLGSVSTSSGNPRWATADNIFRMAVKIFTAKEDNLYFEISANTPFNYLDYPFFEPFLDEKYSIFYRIGRNIILSYYQNKDSVFIVNAF
jgi:hypothetical protein